MIDAVIRRNRGFLEAVLRAAADYFLIHLSMAAAMVVAVFYHGTVAEAAAAGLVLRGVTSYYLHSFLALSLLFPAVFLLNGFYSRSRSYAGRYKAVVLVRGIGLAILLFLAANFLLFREQLIPRSVILVFCGLSMAALPGVRFLKSVLVSRFDIRSRGAGYFPSERAVLVVGGAGYIGSVLVRDLLAAGRKVRILDNLVYGDGSVRGILGHPNLELVAGDCRNIQDVVGAIKGVDAIVHLAAIVGDPACEQDRKTALEVNYAATRMLIEIAKGNGVSRFVFASSCSVYGAADVVMDEKSALHPISLYAATKVDSERALLEACTPAFHPTILRLATVFGHSWRPRFDLVVNLLAARASREGVITIYNSDQWRPFVHTRDVVRAIRLVLDAPIALVSGQTYNVGDSRLNHTLAEVANAIREVFPCTRIECRDNTDRRNYRVSFDKIRGELGFQSAVLLSEGIAELKKVLDEGQVADYTDALYHNQRFLQVTGSPPPRSEMDVRVMAAFAGGTAL